VALGLFVRALWHGPDAGLQIDMFPPRTHDHADPVRGYHGGQNGQLRGLARIAGVHGEPKIWHLTIGQRAMCLFGRGASWELRAGRHGVFLAELPSDGEFEHFVHMPKRMAGADGDIPEEWRQHFIDFVTSDLVDRALTDHRADTLFVNRDRAAAAGLVILPFLT
jgi:hypothetical protein